MPNQEEEAAAHPLIYQKPDRLEEKDKSRNRILQSVEDSQRHYKIGEITEAEYTVWSTAVQATHTNIQTFFSLFIIIAIYWRNLEGNVFMNCLFSIEFCGYFLFFKPVSCLLYCEVSDVTSSVKSKVINLLGVIPLS